MSATFLEEQIKQLSRKIVDLTDSLASGQAKDYAEYREMVGRIRSFNEAKQAATDIQKQWDDAQ